MKFYRKIIRVQACDSPNVRLALEQQARGVEPSGEVVVPGVLTWQQYQQRLATWDKVRICVGIHAQFYLDAAVLMFPPDWLNRAEEQDRAVKARDPRYVNDKWNGRRKITGVGIDPAEGGDRTTMAAGDRFGLVKLAAKRTPDTAQIVNEALAFVYEHKVEPARVCIDAGGGGKQVADQMRERGCKVRTVAFGEAVSAPPRRYGARPETVPEKLEHREERYAWFNRRAQMYGELREALDPSFDGIFTLPAGSEEADLLRQELAPIPLLYDREGRFFVLPKGKSEIGAQAGQERTLTSIIGHSPDCADALVLMWHAVNHAPDVQKAGAF